MNKITKISAMCIAAAMSMTAIGIAHAQNYPKMKAGLWELKTVGASGLPGAAGGEPTLMCLDDTVQADMLKMGQGMMASLCSKNDINVSGSQITSEVECKLGTSTMRSKSVTTFNGDTSYRAESTGSYDPPFFGIKDVKTVSDAKHLGPCKSGMKPGDMITGGRTINIKDAIKGAESFGRK